jgi:hypothetical protein
MAVLRRFCAAIAMALAMIGALLAPGSAAQATTSDHQPAGGLNLVTLQKVGDPAWVPVDVHVFTAPFGTAADNYAEFLQTGQAILPPPYYGLYTGLGIGPGSKKEHPPYTHDMADGIRNAGYQNGPVFGPTQFSNGQGVFFVWMVVPTKGTTNVGSSPDFTSGPIIPNSLFPITFSGVTERNGAVYDPNLGTFSVPAINSSSVVPPINVDGFSHFPVFYADNSDFGPPGTPLQGLYSYKVTMRDALGNGWNIAAYFAVL